MGRDVSKLKAKGGGKWKYMSEKDMLGSPRMCRAHSGTILLFERHTLYRMP